MLRERERDRFSVCGDEPWCSIYEGNDKMDDREAFCVHGDETVVSIYEVNIEMDVRETCFVFMIMNLRVP